MARRAAEAAARAAADLAARGFAVAIQKLADSGVPAVGHNGMFDACYTLEKFLRETDGSLDAARAAFDERFGCPYYDTKLLAQTFLDAYAAAGSLRAPGSARAEDNLANTVPPLDTALGPLYKTLTECALPRMMAKENEAAGAAPEAAEAGAPGLAPVAARRRGGGRGVVGVRDVQKRPRRGRLAALATVCLIGSSSPRASSATPSRWSLGASLGSVRRRARRNRRSRTRLGTTRS